MRDNYNKHIAELQHEVKFLKVYKPETPEAEMLRSQSLAIKTMQIENAVKAFTL
jgi:uncharacterized protein YqcC (DUF446 family)